MVEKEDVDDASDNKVEDKDVDASFGEKSSMMSNNTPKREKLKTIVVGSGPGGTGFIKRALERSDADTFEWFEEGRMKKVLTNWPNDYASKKSKYYLHHVQRKSSKILKAARFCTFGGGGVANSGGPLILLSSTDPRLQAAISTHGNTFLKEEICSHAVKDPTSDSWIKRYINIGYNAQPHFLTNHNSVEDCNVGYGATTFRDGTRTQVARDVLKSDRVVLHLGKRVKRALFDSQKRAIGVELLDCTKHYADRVVLAGGVFGTYEILVHSGIGSAKDIKTAGVKTVIVDETVGQSIGDDSGVLFLHKGGRSESNKASHGADIFAIRGDKYSIKHWGRIVFDSLSISTPIKFRWNSLLRNFFNGYSLVKVDLPARYHMSLSLTQNRALLLDDTKDKVDNFCLHDDDFSVLKQAQSPPIMMSMLSRLFGISYITPKKKIGSGQRVSNFHFHGGTHEITSKQFSVKGTKGLYISDASVTNGYRFGAPTTNIYLIGFAVADSIYDNLEDVTKDL